MEDYFNDFMIYLQEVKHASKNTLQAYQNDLKKLQLFFEKQDINSVTKISETSLNSYILMLEKDLSPASVSRNIAAMKAFILYLIKQGIMQGDPTERIKLPKVHKKAPQIIEEASVDKLLNLPDLKTSKGLRDRAILELLYATGIKVSELISLKLLDVNMPAKYISCREKRERVIPFGKTAKTALQDYLKVRSDYFDKGNTNDFLFLNASGEPLSRQGLWKILKSYARSAGLGNINPNALRHSFAAHLIENGADLGSVQEFLGHADITTTQLYLSKGYKNSREVYMNTHPRA